MSRLDDALDQLATKITPTPPENEPRPVLRRWGVVGDYAAADGSYTVNVSGIDIPGVFAIVGTYVAGDVAVVDFSGPDPMLVGARVDLWHEVGAAGEPAFAAGWGNEAGADAAVRFRKVNGRVLLGGHASGGSGTIFTLPAGYRPWQRERFATNGFNGAADVHSVIDISTGGAVAFIAGGTGWLALDGCTFIAEQ